MAANFVGALTLELKSGLEERKPYAALHLRNDTPFSCETFYDETGGPTLYECRFDRMPETTLKPVESPFFHVDFQTRKGAFVVRILPRKRSLLWPLPPPVHRQPILPGHKMARSAHWVVLGYTTDVPPYLGPSRPVENRLSFPLDLKRYAMPSVGAVDINGEPVFMKNNRDVERFLAIKEAFARGRYTKAYDLATEAMELYPDSIFASDFLRYRIKALFRSDLKEHADEIIRLGKLFIKRYASDEYLPEVLLILARVYSANGFVSDANYFFDRLISEHPGTRYANLGLIYLGDQLYINGKSKAAMKSYLEAYYNAKHLDVASLAAYKLGIRYLERGEIDKGVGFIRKIWQKNPDFLLKDREDAHKLAQQLASHDRYALAIAIDKALLKRMKKLDAPYEEILFEIGEWYDAMGQTKEAIAWYERYLKEFAFGTYSDRAKKSLDALFVVSGDTNATKALAKYEAIMRDYRGTPIADRALAAKIRLLVAQKSYKEALALGEAAKKMADPKARQIAEEALKKAARAVFAEAVKGGECQEAVSVMGRYGVEPTAKDYPFLYRCYIRYARYDKALQIAREGLKKQPDRRKVWTCRAMHALALAGRAKEALAAAEELKALAGGDPSGICPTYLWDLVRLYHRTGAYAKEMELLHRMSRRFAGDMRLADLYRLAYADAKKAGDRLQRLWLLRQLMALQRQTGSHPYSPWVEFEAVRLLKKEGRYDEALMIARRMKTLKLTGQKRARWLYELALLERRAGNKAAAKKAFEACAKTPGAGAWGDLCREALSLQEF